MSEISPREAERLSEAGAVALRRNEPIAARRCFQRLVDVRPTDADAWIGLALASRGMGDENGARAAIDQALAVQPNQLRALVMKADSLALAGDGRAAHAFYGAAVAHAPVIESLSAEMRGEIRRAQRQLALYSRSYEDHLTETLSRGGFDASRSSGRFAHALDLLFGRKQVYYQSPTSFYFPELPQRQFYEREEFPWLAELESETARIRDELLAVLRDEGAFSPYVRGGQGAPRRDYGGLLDNPDWSAFYLIHGGDEVAEAVARCPETLAALKVAPLCEAFGRAPSVLFSLLRPHVRIPPHTGQTNARLICHLPLIVPGGGALRVGNETRGWSEGQALIFDDSIEHEAWNDSDRARVVLLFDIWRPELTDEERTLVSALLGAVASYGGQAVAWD